LAEEKGATFSNVNISMNCGELYPQFPEKITV
jgi:hypothetical protein